MVEDPGALASIATGVFPDEIERISEADCDWVCEAISEDLELKRALLDLVERHRKPGSIVTTNTSGIRLRAIVERAGTDLKRAVTVTHFFDPVKVMKLVELIPGEQTEPGLIERLEPLLSKRLGNGVVHAKDTFNFIANRIGCFWMLAGLHKAEPALRGGLDMKTVDALVSAHSQDRPVRPHRPDRDRRDGPGR